MSKHIFLLLTFSILSFISFAQNNSTSFIYSASIDSVISILDTGIKENTILIRNDAYYNKAIDSYKGKNHIIRLASLSPPDNSFLNHTYLLMTLSPILISKGRIFIQLRTETIEYKSKKKWKINSIKEIFYYVFFEHSKADNSYSISNVAFGPNCFNTTD